MDNGRETRGKRSAESSTPTSTAMRGREKELKGAESGGGAEKFEKRGSKTQRGKWKAATLRATDGQRDQWTTFISA